MQQHQRVHIVQAAQRELDAWVAEWRQRHQLTAAEEILCLSRGIKATCGDVIRGERNQ